MSKTSVRKSLEQFDAAELRQLIFDLYAKSKEAKEILDFYAVPDIAKNSRNTKSRLPRRCGVTLAAPTVRACSAFARPSESLLCSTPATRPSDN